MAPNACRSSSGVIAGPPAVPTTTQMWWAAAPLPWLTGSGGLPFRVIADVAAELPLIAICELMGVPLDRRKRMFELTNIMIGMDDPELTTTQEEGMMAMMEMFGIAQEVAAMHRENPEEDLISDLVGGVLVESLGH